MKQYFVGSIMLLALSAACVVGQSFEARAEGASAPGQSNAEQQGDSRHLIRIETLTTATCTSTPRIRSMLIPLARSAPSGRLSLCSG